MDCGWVPPTSSGGRVKCGKIGQKIIFASPSVISQIVFTDNNIPRCSLLYQRINILCASLRVKLIVTWYYLFKTDREVCLSSIFATKLLSSAICFSCAPSRSFNILEFIRERLSLLVISRILSLWALFLFRCFRRSSLSVFFLNLRPVCKLWITFWRLSASGTRTICYWLKQSRSLTKRWSVCLVFGHDFVHRITPQYFTDFTPFVHLHHKR